MKASLDKKPTRSLTAADVCDRCSARAAVKTVALWLGPEKARSARTHDQQRGPA
jgi:hypothetical protein